jgi:nitrate/TMAO reductase-like tetraheme cytochrome c subunit
MNKRLITLLLAAGIAVIFVATGLQAGTTVEDTFKMEDPGYTKRKKGAPKFKLVEFTHKKHAEDYGISCGSCHHDDKGAPIEGLKMGDDVQKCSECHNKFKKDKKNKKDIMVHENALHKNCIDCHKAFNIEKNPKDKKGMKGPAPASCGKCHAKAE